MTCAKDVDVAPPFSAFCDVHAISVGVGYVCVSRFCADPKDIFWLPVTKWIVVFIRLDNPVMVC